MQVSSRTVAQVVVVEMTGRLDSVAAGPAGYELDAIAKGPIKQVVLNLQHVDYASSAGLRIIVRTAKQLNNQRGELKLCAANPTVKQALETSGFNALIRLVDTEEAAIRSFSPASSG